MSESIQFSDSSNFKEESQSLVNGTLYMLDCGTATKQWVKFHCDLQTFHQAGRNTHALVCYSEDRDSTMELQRFIISSGCTVRKKKDLDLLLQNKFMFEISLATDMDNNSKNIESAQKEVVFAAETEINQEAWVSQLKHAIQVKCANSIATVNSLGIQRQNLKDCGLDNAILKAKLPGNLGTLTFYLKPPDNTGSSNIINNENILTISNAKNAIFQWLKFKSSEKCKKTTDDTTDLEFKKLQKNTDNTTDLEFFKSTISSNFLQLTKIVYESNSLHREKTNLQIMQDIIAEGNNSFSIFDWESEKLLTASQLDQPLSCLESHSNKIPMIRIQRHDIESNQLRCTLVGWNKVEDMNSKTYIAYNFKCYSGALQWSVTHRYSDFIQLLRAIKIFAKSPSGKLILPSLPPKTYGKRNLADDFIKHRSEALENMLNVLISMKWPQSVPKFLSFMGMLSTTREDQYKKRNIIHISKLTKMAAPGDIILFRTKSTLNWLQRGATRSEWDHVGVVTLLFDSSRLWLLEASGDGVTCFPLVSRIQAYAKEFAERIAIRHFKRKFSFESKQRLREFSKNANGKPYSLTPAKLLRNKKRKSKTPALENFFCSELVAAALKAMGALENRKSSSYYWPCDFRDGGAIEGDLRWPSSVSTTSKCIERKHAKHFSQHNENCPLSSTVIINCRFVEVGFAVDDHT
eukprot:GSMAST32.ASY1.ANO1.1336.1 assembled CDS